MARRIGEVFVSVEADTSLFRAQAVAGVTKALAGIDGKIPITADTAQARAQIDALRARMAELNRQLASVTIGANGKPAEAAIRKLQLQLKALADTVANIAIGADTSRIDAAIAKTEAELAHLGEEASGLKLDADDKALTLKILTAQTQAFKLQAALDSEDFNGDDTLFRAKIASLLAQVELLKADAHNIAIVADAMSVDATITATEAKLAALQKQAADLKIGGSVDLAGLAAAEGQLLGLEQAFKTLTPEIDATNAKLITGATAFGRFGLGALNARVALFGGITAVSGWHIAIDGIIESLAVIVPALVTAAAGLVAFGLAGSDAAIAVYNRMLNLHTVMDATGATIAPFTRNLENLHAVVRPQVWQLYGDAIAIAGTKQGVFNKLAVSTGSVIDTLAARITVMATTSGTGLSNFLAAGTRDLEQFGRIALSLGDAFGNLIKVTQQTGIAEILLTILNAAAKLFDMFTKIPTPILATVVALHAIWLYSGLAATGVIALLRPLTSLAAAAAGAEAAGTAMKDLAVASDASVFARLGATFKDLGTNIGALPARVSTLAKSFGTLVAENWPAILVGVGVAALITIGIWLSKTKTAAQNLVTEMNSLVAASTVFNVINSLGAALIQTNQALTTSQKSLTTAVQQGSSATAEEAIRFGPLGSGAQSAASNVSTLTEEHQKLVAQLTLVTGRLAGVAAAYGTQGLAGAEALAAVAGVKVNDLMSTNKTVWAAALQQINGVVTGYANMGQGATQLANDINVLTVSQSSQLKNIQTLNTAFDQFTKIVSGPIDTFLTFADALKRFGNDASVAGAQMTGLGSGFTTTSKKMTDASLQLQSDFQSTFAAATQMADAMRLTGTAADKQISAIKNVVQVLIPLAGSNKAAAAEISALAQEAGGPATTNLQSLAKWAGNTKDPLTAAQNAANAAAISFSNMSLDAQKLGTTLSQDLTKEMATAVENAVGLQGAMNNFAKAIANSGTSITATNNARKTLLADLTAVGIKGTSAQSIIQAISDRLTQNGSAATASHAARAQVATDIQAIIAAAPTASSDIATLAGDIQRQGANSSAAAGARKQLIADLVASGVSSQTATSYVNGLTTAVGKLPKNTALSITMKGSGSFSLSEINAATGKQQGAASGMFVRTGSGPTADDVPALLSKGELVVPTRIVKSGAVDHLRGSIPGFAAGGVVGSGGIPGYAAGGVVGNLTPGYIAGTYTQFKTTMTNAMVAQMRAALKIAEAAAAAAAAASAAAISSAGVSNASAEAALKSAAAKAGWTGAQWTALFNVEMREAGFSLTAQNPTSGAYGMAQFINGPSEYAQYGGNSTTAAGQAVAMVNYIAQRYGTPAAAWAHEQAFGWYDQGGILPPGLSLALNTTGRGEVVQPAGHQDNTAQMVVELRRQNELIKNLIGVTASVPAGVGRHVGGALGGAAQTASFRSRYSRGGA